MKFDAFAEYVMPERAEQKDPSIVISGDGRESARGRGHPELLCGGIMAHLASRSVIIALASCMLAGLSALNPAAAREVVAFIAGSGIRPTKAEGVDRPTSAPDAPAAAAPIRTAIPAPEPAEVTIAPADTATPDLRPTATTPAAAAPEVTLDPFGERLRDLLGKATDRLFDAKARASLDAFYASANTRRCGPRTARCMNGRRR